MSLEKRIAAFVKLGEFLSDFLLGRKISSFSDKYRQLDKVIDECFLFNGWFTRPNVIKALEGIALMLQEKGLTEFAKQIKEPKSPKTVAVIMAGNIPAVGFHDLLCILLSGNNILIKLSSDDKLLIPFFAEFLEEAESGLKGRITYSEGKLHDFDAVIATGSNNSELYFKRYFGKYPHIIRRNRSSVAVLSGKETNEELKLLGHDIFDYFGLGCRNVSKLFVPNGYDFNLFFESIFEFSPVADNKKYANNYDYQQAVYLLNREKFLSNNFLIVKQSEQLHSPVAVCFWEGYADKTELERKLNTLEGELQCIVTNMELWGNTVPLGSSQCPTIFTFADNVNTLVFLNKLH